MTVSEPIGPDYQQLTDALSAAELNMSAAEAHGVLTGAIVAPTPSSLSRLFFGAGTQSAPAVERLLAELADAGRETEHRLRGIEFGFEPLLPVEATLSERVDALADWCRGFVYGLAAGGIREPDELQGDAAEFLRDALQIGEAQADSDVPEEEQERDLAEIVEYVRVGVQLVYEAVHGAAE